MRKICKVTVNNEPFLANCGELLLDWALLNGVELPHDCRSGICGACRVRLVEGKVFGGHAPGDDMIHACQARIVSDLEITTEDVPDRSRCQLKWPASCGWRPMSSGSTSSCRNRFATCRVSIARCNFETSRRDSTARPIRSRAPPTIGCCIFTSAGLTTAGYLRRLAGRSASATASRLRVHPAAPSAAKPFRPPGSRRQRHRFRADVVGRSRGDHGAAEAGNHIRRLGAKTSVALHACRAVPPGAVSQCHDHSDVSEPQRVSPAIRIGRPTDHLPKLSPNDLVYAAGAPAMTESVARIARTAGASCHTDPFVPNTSTFEPATVRGSAQKAAHASW